MAILGVFLLALEVAGGGLSFALRVEGIQKTLVTLSGPAGDLPAGAFRGAIALNGSAAELPVSGTVFHAAGEFRLPVAVRYMDVPADWADRFQAGSFTYRLRGSTGGPPREWAGTRTWKDVELDGAEAAQEQFLSLQDVRLTRLSLTSSEAVAEVAIANPLSFDLKIAETAYSLSANGRDVGEGATRGMILRAGHRSVLTLPIEIDHGELISAAGKALLSGGEVDVTLRGRLVVRLKGGDLVVPLDLSGRLSDAS